MNALSNPWDFRGGDSKASAPSPIGALEVLEGLAILHLELPAPSRWSPLEQRLFVEALARLGGRSDVQAILLHGDRLFDEGPDGDRQDFHLVVDAVVDCSSPVIAVITGQASGAGLELALACAARVAAPGSSFAMPDLTAGRLPTHGAVERLPRLVGMTRAAEMIVLDRRLDAPAAAACGLVDRIGDDPLAAGCELARSPRQKAAGSETPDPEAATAEVFALRLRLRRLAPDQTVPLAALQALEAAIRLPARRAMIETARLAQGLASNDQAQNLAYAHAGAAALAAWGSTADIQALAFRLHWPLLREAVHMLDEGATPGQIDRRLAAFGFAEGPFARSDRLGLAEVFLKALDSAGPSPWLSYSPTLDLMVDAERLGGAAPGWFRPGDPAAGPRTFDPEVAQLLQASATFQRLSRQSIPDEGVAERCLLAAINGAAEVLKDRSDLSPALIDAVWTTALGFPTWKGGPLRQADAMGLDRVVEGLSALDQRRATAGAPSEIIRQCAARGAGIT